MDFYFYMITIIDIFILGTMCIFTMLSAVLGKRQKNYLMASFILIAFISILEVITILVDGTSVQYRAVNIISNYLGFGLTPAVSICFVRSLSNDSSKFYDIVVEILYLIFLAASIPFQLVFGVSRDNIYVRGQFFWIYIVVYLCAIIYLMIITLKTTYQYQSRCRIMVYPIIIFLIMGTTIQVLFSHIHITWFCVTQLSVLYYIYCSEMRNQLDGLTGLLNQKSYLYRTVELDYSGTLIVFDIDDFKNINDQYGHIMGDRCLCEIADCIKKAYFKSGYCYRIGGDEFCVILKKDADAEACYENLIRNLDKKRKSISFLPYVSVGAAEFSIGSDVLKVKESADQEMYKYKKEQKITIT